MIKKQRFFAVLTIFLILSFALFVLLPKEEKEISILSPIPDFLNISENSQVSNISLWLPSLENIISAKLVKPQVSAKSALLFDTKSKKVLYEKNAKQKLPIASLTKIMTAIIALENPKKDNKYKVSEKDLVGENSMGLTAGEVLSLEELLYGLILPSGNDAAETLASNFSGGRAHFIKAMNDKTKALGLKDTNFTNPTGLEGDGNQYSTAYDLMVMTEYAMTNFLQFRKTASAFQITIEATKTHKAYFLENETNLISSYPGVKGVKVGYTPEAGFCLVTYLDFGGHKIIGVLLGSENRRQEMKDLLDYSLKSLGTEPPPHI